MREKKTVTDTGKTALEIKKRLFYWGVQPSEVDNISFADALLFLEQQEKHRKDELTFMAQVGYGNALVSRSVFSKAPLFEQLFPDFKPEPRKRTAEEYKAAMLQFALTMNKKYK